MSAAMAFVFWLPLLVACAGAPARKASQRERVIPWEQFRDAELRLRSPEFPPADPKAMDFGEGYRTKSPERAEETTCRTSRSTIPSEAFIESLKCARALTSVLDLTYELQFEASGLSLRLLTPENEDGEQEEPRAAGEAKHEERGCFERVLSRISVPREVIFRKLQEQDAGPEASASPSWWTLRPAPSPLTEVRCWARRVPIEASKWVFDIDKPFSSVRFVWSLDRGDRDDRKDWKPYQWERYWEQKLLSLILSPHFLWGQNSDARGDWLTERVCDRCFREEARPNR